MRDRPTKGWIMTLLCRVVKGSRLDKQWRSGGPINMALTRLGCHVAIVIMP